MKSDEIDKDKTFQGFYDDDGNILDRYDAYDEAERCGQLKPNSDLMFCKQLYSEDLW
mgnify:CR=1 FL=1